MRVTKKSLALTFGVATMMAVAACAPSTGGGGTEPAASGDSSESAQASGDPIDVALITSTTGPLAAYGKTFIEGFEAGLDYATDGTGEVGGSEIVVETIDDGGDTDKAVAAARDAIGQGHKILTGTASSGIALSLAEQAEQNKVLYISGPAAADAVTGINDYTFRSGRQSLQDVATAGSFIDVDGQKVLVFAQDNAFGQGNLAAVEGLLGAQGAEVTSVMVPEDVTEFTPFAAQVLDAAPEMVFVAWAGATSGAMWQSLDQQGVLDDITVVTGLGDTSTYNAYGAASEKIDFLNHYFPGAAGNDVEAAMIEHVEGAGGTPDLFTPDGFTAAQMIVRAIEEAGGADDVDAMVTALEGWSFDGPKGSYTIRESDHALIQPMFQAKLVSDGNGGWQPELVSQVAAEDVAPPEAG
ncbi:substrate-binding domain-containing protein [Georgenia sp. EYE_87]|uniref:substrate-binding domain-containing protein n=1 Tax=Georgenia sp. EYE_87 TaxID=2853448 RepID=UPI0020069A05|nr:substrate-binding domain-containing protein [Georgenia sp. EYE_87]MCK6209619.1 substrate-binding domain-containing protein [Georgenia sp. EYE_87]